MFLAEINNLHSDSDKTFTDQELDMFMTQVQEVGFPHPLEIDETFYVSDKDLHYYVVALRLAIEQVPVEFTHNEDEDLFWSMEDEG